MEETFHALIFFSFFFELEMFKAIIAAFICFKLLQNKVSVIYMETSVSIKVRSGLCRSLSSVQSSLEMCTYADLFIFLW